MSIYTEREMLKYLLECIQEEKKVLRGMYQDIKQQETDLLNRVRELDNIGRSETKGVYDVQGLISDLSETLSRVSGLIPRIPIETVLEEVRDIANGINSPAILDNVDGNNTVLKSREYKLDKQNSLYRENQKALANRKEEFKSKKFNAKTHGDLLISFMKDMGRPVSTAEIKGYLSERGFAEGNTSNRMTAMIKQHPKVSKVGHGYYQISL